MSSGRMDKFDPWSAREVAEWAARHVDDCLSERFLWMRMNMFGPGWMLTEKDEAPKGGSGWVRACSIQWEEASAIMSGKGERWRRLRLLADRIAEAMPSR